MAMVSATQMESNVDVELTSLSWLHNLNIMPPALPTPPTSPKPPKKSPALKLTLSMQFFFLILLFWLIIPELLFNYIFDSSKSFIVKEKYKIIHLLQIPPWQKNTEHVEIRNHLFPMQRWYAWQCEQTKTKWLYQLYMLGLRKISFIIAMQILVGKWVLNYELWIFLL